MLFKTRLPNDPKSSEITPKGVFLNRRRFIGAAGAGAGLALAGLPLGKAEAAKAFSNVGKGPFSAALEPTAKKLVTTYNNFYEFGTNKTDPAANSGKFEPKPWTVKVDGMAGKPGTYDLGDLIDFNALQERVYRFRCVEAWSMVVPWVGVPLADVINKLEPASDARYVAFETVVRPEQMPGQQRAILKWPYVEGLRMDEALNPVTLLAVGIYGEEMPNQNGAPVRLVVPWKYGFKSIKSIVRISFTRDAPPATWNIMAPDEYGFYSNVNPGHDHPRWSQASERKVDGSLFSKRIPTLMFNGYGEQVAHMYAGMDLHKFY